jgi:uncharacterized membrane protein YdjX (TVP38/TMEM64 family)
VSAHSRRRAVLFVALLVVALAVAGVVAKRAGWFDYGRVTMWALSLRRHNDPVSTAVIFVLVWGVATTLGFPAVPLMVAGGALFGVCLGTLLNLTGTALGALGAYLLARVAAPDVLRRWLARRVPLDELSERARFLTLVRLRLLPVVPFSAVSYGAGITHVPVWTFLVSTVAGQLPSTLLYSYFADRLLRSVDRGGGAVARNVAMVSGILLFMSLIPRLVRRRTNRRPA